ncbi:hypothetical protein D3C84_338700 [compost metagenome]
MRVAEAELGAEAVHAVFHLQVVDAAKGHVVQEHHVDLAPLLNRGRQLRVQHHVGAVAHQRIDLTIRLGEFHAQRSVDLVTHAGIAVLDVVGVHALAAPAALQVARQAAGGGDDHCVVRQGFIEHPEHAALGQAGAGQLDEFAQHRRVHVVVDFRDEILGLVFHLIDAIDFLIQLRLGLTGLIAPARAIITQRFGQRRQTGSGVRQQLHAVEFQSVAGADIEVEKLHLRVLKQGLRRGGEVAVTGANANDQISVPGQQVRRQATGFADPADIQRMAGHHRALAGLGFGERNVEALGKCLQCDVGTGITNPATANDQRFALAFE